MRAGRRDVQAAQEVQERRLARAARAHEGDELARVHVEVQPLQDVDLLAAAPVALVEPARADEALAVAVAVDSDHACPRFVPILRRPVPVALAHLARGRPSRGLRPAEPAVPRRSASVRWPPAGAGAVSAPVAERERGEPRGLDLLGVRPDDGPARGQEVERRLEALVLEAARRAGARGPASRSGRRRPCRPRTPASPPPRTGAGRRCRCAGGAGSARRGRRWAARGRPRSPRGRRLPASCRRRPGRPGRAGGGSRRGTRSASPGRRCR